MPVRVTEVVPKLSYTTYHYGDCDVVDHGWGCSYRNAQTLSSALKIDPVPTVQEMLAVYGLSLPTGGRGKRYLWIEPPQVKHILYKLRGIRCHTLLFTQQDQLFRMLRSTPSDFDRQVTTKEDLLTSVDKHFVDTGGLPVIIDDSIYSYAIAPNSKKDRYTLIDPHVSRGKRGSVRVLTKNEFVSRPGWMLLFPTYLGHAKVQTS